MKTLKLIVSMGLLVSPFLTAADGNTPLNPVPNRKCVRIWKGPGDVISGCYTSEGNCVGECYRRSTGGIYVGECQLGVTTCYPFLNQWSFAGEETTCIDTFSSCECNDQWVPISGTITYVDCNPSL
jgi:hypothetical protein